MHTSVFIIDDEVELTEYTAKYFNLSGVDTQYAFDAETALKFLEENTCSLILLDINLGGSSGFDLCQKLRKEMDVPILFISARTSEDDMILALNIGGDDYICKPYSLGVLLAKVKAILKRYENRIYHLGNATIDLKSGLVSKDGREVRLKAMEYKLLQYMLCNSNRIIPKDEFFAHVWETEYVGDVTLNVHIRHLREKLEDHPNEPQFIKTVWGVGFILEM